MLCRDWMPLFAPGRLRAATLASRSYTQGTHPGIILANYTCIQCDFTSINYTYSTAWPAKTTFSFTVTFFCTEAAAAEAAADAVSVSVIACCPPSFSLCAVEIFRRDVFAVAHSWRAHDTPKISPKICGGKCVQHPCQEGPMYIDAKQVLTRWAFRSARLRFRFEPG